MKPPDPSAERSADPASPETTPHPARAEALWEAFLSRDNLARALRRVERNGGAPGPDGMTVAALMAICGVLFEPLGGGIFFIMVLVVLPVFVLRLRGEHEGAAA